MKERLNFYLWVTRLAEILANEKKCRYAVSFVAQYHVKRRPSTYDPSEHDNMVIQRAFQLQCEGWTVYVENQNSFKYKGKYFPITVAGRPDLVAIKGTRVIVEDCKTGTRKDSHRMQMLLYMMLLPASPETKELCQGKIPQGRLIYRDGVVEISPWDVDKNFKSRLWEILAIICNSTLPKPTASQEECRYCTIPSTFCPARADADFAA
jgi:hypothetical protein